MDFQGDRGRIHFLGKACGVVCQSVSKIELRVRRERERAVGRFGKLKESFGRKGHMVEERQSGKNWAREKWKEAGGGKQEGDGEEKEEEEEEAKGRNRWRWKAEARGRAYSGRPSSPTGYGGQASPSSKLQQQQRTLLPKPVREASTSPYFGASAMVLPTDHPPPLPLPTHMHALLHLPPQFPSYLASVAPFYADPAHPFMPPYPPLLPPMPPANAASLVPWLVPPVPCVPAQEKRSLDGRESTLSENETDSRTPTRSIEREKNECLHFQQKDVEKQDQDDNMLIGDQHHMEQHAGVTKGGLKHRSSHRRSRTVVKRSDAWGNPANLLQGPCHEADSLFTPLKCEASSEKSMDLSV